jgi:hypothetical protein
LKRQTKETLIKDMSPDSPMDFSSDTGKNRSDTGGKVKEKYG